MSWSKYFIRTIVCQLILLVGFFSVSFANAADISCFCSDDLSNFSSKFAAQESEFQGVCLVMVTKDSECNNESQVKNDGKRYTNQCEIFFEQKGCLKAAADWNEKKRSLLAASVAQQEAGRGGLTSKLIPDCALADTVKGDCRNINIFVTLAIKISTYLFSIIGGVSLVMFVYGGFLLVLSEGSEEKISQAKEVLTAVVIGLLVAFGGYLLIKFVGQIVGIDQAFRLN